VADEEPKLPICLSSSGQVPIGYQPENRIKALGLDMPATMLGRANEVIE
jgi:hypothetical protein